MKFFKIALLAATIGLSLNLQICASTAATPADFQKNFAEKFSEKASDMSIQNADFQSVENQSGSKRAARRLDKIQKRLSKKIQKRLARQAEIEVDLSDPIDKFMWYWLGLWAIAIGLGLIGAIIGVGVFGWLATIAGLVGTICLIVWLVKKFGSA